MRWRQNALIFLNLHQLDDFLSAAGRYLLPRQSVTQYDTMELPSQRGNG
jgi:hypothetical protein